MYSSALRSRSLSRNGEGSRDSNSWLTSWRRSSSRPIGAGEFAGVEFIPSATRWSIAPGVLQLHQQLVGIEPPLAWHANSRGQFANVVVVDDKQFAQR